MGCVVCNFLNLFETDQERLDAEEELAGDIVDLHPRIVLRIIELHIKQLRKSGYG